MHRACKGMATAAGRAARYADCRARVTAPRANAHAAAGHHDRQAGAVRRAGRCYSRLLANVECTRRLTAPGADVRNPCVMDMKRPFTLVQGSHNLARGLVWFLCNAAARDMLSSACPRGIAFERPS